MIRKKHTFTLIEILVAISVISVIGMIIYKMFVSSIKVVDGIEKIKDNSVGRLLISKVRYDLSNFSLYYGRYFKGNRESIEFYVNNPYFINQKREIIPVWLQDPIYKVEYKFFPGKDLLERSLYKLNRDAPVKIDRFVGVKSFSIDYVFFSKKEGFYESDELDNIIPVAVHLKFILKDEEEYNMVIPVYIKG